MKKILAIFLALTMLLSLAACGGGSDATSAPTQGSTAPSTQAAEPQPTGTLPDTATLSTISYFMLSMSNASSNAYMTAYPDENGQAYVEYAGAEKKVGTLPASALSDIAAALNETTLADLRDVSEYTEGTDYASMYITFEDGTYLSADYSGAISKEFAAAFELMDKFFQDLTAELPVYVPQPVIMGVITGDELAAAQEILAGSGIDPLDSMTISGIFANDELNGYAGLSSSDGITNGVIVSPLMMTTPYSLTIVSAAGTDQIDYIRQDFEANLEWNKWVCVTANNALIAQKDNMVLCLLGNDTLYTGTAAAIQAAGWTNIVTFTNSGSDIIVEDVPAAGIEEGEVGSDLPDAEPVA